MNDYEILLALNSLEIARHKSVVHALSGVCKAGLQNEIAAEIVWRKAQIEELRSRRHRLTSGAALRRKGVKITRSVGSTWLKYG